MSPNPDTIARLVNAHMDAMGAAIDAAFTADAVSDTDKPASREAMHRLAASARQHLHHLAMEFAGGAAYARPEPSPQPAAPAAVAGWVVRGVDGATLLHTWSPDGDFDDRSRPHVFCDRDEAEKDAEHWRHAIGRRYPVVVLPVDAAGNVLEERAPAPDVVAQCRAAEPTPAPREPDGWVVVNEGGHAGPAWLHTEVVDARATAREYAAVAVGHGDSYTARPFWLDTSPVHPSSLTDVVTTLEEERNMLRANIAALREASDVAVTVRDAEAATLRAEVKRLRAALRDIATTCGGGIHETATTEFHCMVADEVRLVVERLTRERDSAISLARQCREVALGERSRIAKALVADGCKLPVAVIRALPAPMLPEVP